MLHCWLIRVRRARLAYRGRLVWVTKVGPLGGPGPGALLVRIRELGLDGYVSMSSDCPVVRAIALEDEARTRRRSRDLERATGAVG